jgi:hypothetical protein
VVDVDAVLSDEQLERLRSFPGIGCEELNKYFTLMPREHGFLDAPGRGPEARLGLAVQLCTLPWLGYVPDDLLGIPQAALLCLAGQMAVAPAVLEVYDRATRKRPRTEGLDHQKRCTCFCRGHGVDSHILAGRVHLILDHSRCPLITVNSGG